MDVLTHVYTVSQRTQAMHKALYSRTYTLYTELYNFYNILVNCELILSGHSVDGVSTEYYRDTVPVFHRIPTC